MENIKSFLAKTRKSTYASGLDAKEIDGGKLYLIKEGDLEYRDTYFDQERYFQGQEVVFQKEKPVWSMSYRGAASSQANTKEVFEFLQKILRQHSDDVRLPGGREYDDGDWRYEDYCDGTMEEFIGKERIYYKNELVHWMRYFGGTIK